jgi:hypothetical protein
MLGEERMSNVYQTSAGTGRFWEGEKSIEQLLRRRPLQPAYGQASIQGELTISRGCQQTSF